MTSFDKVCVVLVIPIGVIFIIFGTISAIYGAGLSMRICLDNPVF